jgi:hypothetical protein
MIGKKIIGNNLLRLSNSAVTAETASKLEVLCDQLIDSAIVGGITWLTQVSISQNINFLGFAMGFGLTFLFKMKDYRKIKG